MIAEQAMDNITVLGLSPLPFQCCLSHVQTVLHGEVEKQSKISLFSGDADHLQAMRNLSFCMDRGVL